MRRIAVFAHYDKDNKIEDYVIYYLRGLRQVTDKIIFVSDCDLKTEELSKISGLTVAHIIGRHGEYDFGSYKRGFLYALENELLLGCEELIFANDSCYGPFYPLTEMFNAMQEKTADFWSVTKNFFGIEYSNNKIKSNKDAHAQSYFIVFRQNVVESDVFINFMSSIKKEIDKNKIIINYEIGLTKQLNSAGFVLCSYAPEYPEIESMHIMLWEELLNVHVPIIKNSIFRLVNIAEINPTDWQTKIAAKSTYPIELIERDLLRNRRKIKTRIKIKLACKQALYKLKSIIHTIN